MTDARPPDDPRTVLVVDDDRDIQLLLRLELEAEGYDVVTANNGLEALDLVGLIHPHCILLDVMMPELDGWGVLQLLAEPKPPVVVVSGLATDRDQHLVHAVELGALGFVSKPFEPLALLALVAQLIDLDEDSRVARRRALLGEGRDRP